jgi:small nuclear ribonucleoprotein (snRNP)-like protein
MISPYKAHLELHLNTTVSLHRRDAAEIEGELVSVDDFGCTLKQEDNDEYDREIFIAYEDIRGVDVSVLRDDID